MAMRGRATPESARTGTAFPSVRPLPPPGAVEQVLAVDPGTAHCGMAWFNRDLPQAILGGWRLVEVQDRRPFDCLWEVAMWLNELGGRAALLVIEEFKLYPGKMQQQGFSNMGPAEVIGALRWAAGRAVCPRLGVVMQGASLIKSSGREPPALRWMREHHVDLTGSNPHKRDAECHGWWAIGRLLRGKEPEWAGS